MANSNQKYLAARQRLMSFLDEQGFKPHPSEVFCPPATCNPNFTLIEAFEGNKQIDQDEDPLPPHYWVDVAATKGQDYWAFEYKSKNDSIRRGFEQCCAYSAGFNYIVLVADRQRLTSTVHFSEFKRQGFGVWRHHGNRFYSLLPPRRRVANRVAGGVVKRQFQHLSQREGQGYDALITNWFPRQL